MATTASGRGEKTAAAKGSKRRQQKSSDPSEDEIRILAYHLYERRSAGGVNGDPATDWIEAERLLASKPEDKAD